MELKEFRKKIYQKRRNNIISPKDKLIADIACQVINARIKRGLTQEKLAKLIGTKQPAIARLEAGNVSWLPSLEMLFKIANALDTKLMPPVFLCLDNDKAKKIVKIPLNTKTKIKKI